MLIYKIKLKRFSTKNKSKYNMTLDKRLHKIYKIYNIKIDGYFLRKVFYAGAKRIELVCQLLI